MEPIPLGSEPLLSSLHPYKTFLRLPPDSASPVPRGCVRTLVRWPAESSRHSPRARAPSPGHSRAVPRHRGPSAPSPICPLRRGRRAVLSSTVPGLSPQLPPLSSTPSPGCPHRARPATHRYGRRRPRSGRARTRRRREASSPCSLLRSAGRSGNRGRGNGPETQRSRARGSTPPEALRLRGGCGAQPALPGSETRCCLCSSSRLHPVI